MKTLLAATTLLFACVFAQAATFDPATGTGSASQADLQAAYGWTAAEYNKNAGGVSFVYCRADRYTITVQYTTGSGSLATQTQTFDVNYKVATKSTLGATGFTITGYGAETAQGRIPRVGDGHLACEGGTFLPGLGGFLPTQGGVIRGGRITSVVFTASGGPLVSSTNLYGSRKVW